jgi:fibronectin-binding autotransporter adhesin
MKSSYSLARNLACDDSGFARNAKRCRADDSNGGMSRSLHGAIVLAAAATSLMTLPSSAQAQSVPFLDLSAGLTGWTTAGTVSVLTTTDSFDINGNPYSLTPASGQSMAKISPAGAAAGSVDALLGLGANSIESILNNSNGQVTNFGVMTKSYAFNPGTYTFSWAYAATDYVPYNDGVLFSVVGGGSQTLVSLARNGSSSSDTTGPSPGTLILGSYGTVPWQTATFTVATAGSYQVGFADYNWNDTVLDPIFYVSGKTGTDTGTPPPTTGGGPTLVIGATGGNVSASVFDTTSTAYNQPTLTFDGGTLQYIANTTTSVDAALTSNGGTIDTQTYAVTYSGAFSGVGALTDTGAGPLTLSAVNLYTGATLIDAGATLALSGAGSIAASSGVADNGTFDVSGTTSGASVQSLSGGVGGLVVLGNKTLTLSNAAGTFAGSIAGTGGVTVGGGSETLTGTNGYTGTTLIGAGATLLLSGAGSISTSGVLADDGYFSIAGVTAGASLISLSGAGLVALGAQNLTLTNANDTFAGSIGGGGCVTVSGGTETLTGVNTYTGCTLIGPAASLALSGAGSIATSSSVADNGTFDISATTSGASVKTLSGVGAVALGNQTLTLTNAADTFSGGIGGAGGLSVSGGAETLAGANGYTGATSVGSGGTLALLGAGSIANSSGVADNGSFDISATTSGASVKTLSGAGAVALGSQTLTLTNAAGTFAGSIAGSGGVTIGGGTETMSGASAYTGVTAIGAGGTLALGGAGSIAASSGVVDNGSLDIAGVTGGASLKSLSGNGAVALGGQSLTLTNASGTFAGSINGSGGVYLSGGVETLTGVSSYAGGTTVTGAKLVIASDASLGAASGALTLNNSTLENTGAMTSARKLNLVGAVTFLNDSGTSLQMSGPISGTGAVTKNGGGTLVLAGDNRNWGLAGDNAVGGLTENAGLVEVTNAYGLGYGPIVVNSGVIATTVDILTAQTIQINGDTVLNTDAGTTTTLTGNVLTGGNGSCFEKTGTGTLVISGTANLSNGTCVEEGKLSVNGTLLSTVSVASSGTLRGTGLINGTVTVRGTLAPGNSPGTLAVAGTVTMSDGSTYQEDINGTGVGTGPGNYSRLLVIGATSQFIASGAVLNANLLNITGTAAYTPYVPKLGDTFRIITADGGIVGKFATFDQPGGLSSGTRLAIFYDYLGSNSIDLRLVPTSYAAFKGGSSIDGNARFAGAALDRILATDQTGAATATQSALSYQVSGLTAAALPGAMTALAGEVHVDLAAIAPQADQWLQGSIERQLESDSTLDDTGAPLPGHALWLDTSANRGKWSGDDRASGFSDNHTQVAVGFELLADQPHRFGIGFSHSLADVSTADASGSEETNTGFLYGQYSLGPLVLDGMLGAGGGSWESTRGDPLKLSAQDLRASGHGTSSLAGAGVRWQLPVGGMVLQPYARVLWQRAARGSFDEGGTPDALSAPSYSATGLRSLAGISAGSANGSPLASNYTYRVNVGVGHDGGDLVHPTISETLAGIGFSVMAPDVGRTFAQLNLTGTARIASHGYVYLGLSDEARRGKSQEEGVNLGARMNF